MIGARLEEELEEAVGAEEEDVVARAAGGVAERAGEEGLPDANGAEEDHVFLPFDEAEAEEIPDAVAIEGDRGVPVEGFEGLLLFEAGAREALVRFCWSRRSISSWSASSRNWSSESVLWRA